MGHDGADTVTVIEGDLNPGQFAECCRVFGSHSKCERERASPRGTVEELSGLEVDVFDARTASDLHGIQFLAHTNVDSSCHSVCKFKCGASRCEFGRR